jgi:hypothetical protein
VQKEKKDAEVVKMDKIVVIYPICNFVLEVLWLLVDDGVRSRINYALPPNIVKMMFAVLQGVHALLDRTGV